jgi:hypothetical protein
MPKPLYVNLVVTAYLFYITETLPALANADFSAFAGAHILIQSQAPKELKMRTHSQPPNSLLVAKRH